MTNKKHISDQILKCSIQDKNSFYNIFDSVEESLDGQLTVEISKSFTEKFKVNFK